MNRTGKLLLLVILGLAGLAFGQISGPGTTVPNDIVTWNSSTGTQVADPGSFQIYGLSMPMTTMRGNNETQSLVIQGGQDGSDYQNPYGGLTIRGANLTSSGTSGGAAGTVTVQGGDNFATGTVTDGGWLILRSGASTATSGDPVPGHLVISQTFKMPNPTSGYSCSTIYGCKLACLIGHDIVADCGTSPSSNPANNYVGVELLPVTDSTGTLLAANVQVEGYAAVLELSTIDCGSWSVGDIVCVDPSNAGYVVDNHTSLCSTMTPTPTKQVGIVALAGCSVNRQQHEVLLAR
jgi:hypothetical protein